MPDGNYPMRVGAHVMITLEKIHILGSPHPHAHPTNIEKWCLFQAPTGGRDYKLGSEDGVFWKRGLVKSIHFLEILENIELVEILETPQNVENKGESNHS